MYFGDTSPLGKRITIDMKRENTPSTIVGVVGDERLKSLDAEPRPAVYWPHAELPFSFMAAVVRTDVAPLSIVGAVRSEIAALDPEVPVSNVRTMEQVLSDSVARSRFGALLLTIFAGVALLIAAIGIYGVVAYSVAQRTQEIGVRMALGATARDVLRLVLGGGVRLAAAGVTVGLFTAILLSRFVESLLFEVSPTDPATLAGLAIALGAVAMLACYVPARRAARVDPNEALRCE